MSLFQKLVINAVRFYQRTASNTLRQTCRFTPSCSEFMILAVKKYGTFKGIKKGIERICRCHSPNGGIDYP